MKQTLLMLVLLVSACTQATLTPAPSPTASPEVTLALYVRATPTPTSPAVQPTATPTLPPLPSPTPFLYKVKADDTLLIIAYRFGVSLQALKDANPKVNPNLMSVGQELVIPLNLAGAAVGTASATPGAPELAVAPPVCYTAQSGGAWCLARVENRSESMYTNIMVEIIPQGSSAAQAAAPAVQAAPLLERLPPGLAVPVEVYFPGEVSQAAARLLSAQVGGQDDPRYYPVQTAASQVEIAADGLSAHLQGQVSISGPAGRLWLVAAAYAQDSKPAGLRRWEIANPCPAAAGAGGTTSLCLAAYDFSVYSLGAAISRVEVFAEAAR